MESGNGSNANISRREIERGNESRGSVIRSGSGSLHLLSIQNSNINNERFAQMMSIS